ncbi:MAG: hypothetical protein WCE48_03685 [Steroidobacteraceae bacterium]
MRPTAIAIAVLTAGSVHADELDFSLDLRGVNVSGEPSFLYGELGKLRFDSAHDGLQLGRARIAYNGTFGERWRAHVDASSWGDSDKHAIDLTEAFVEFRPYPRGGWRTRVRGGAFYPPLSLENGSAGWQNIYTISSSALDSWVAEEIRAIGLEAQATWLGTKQGHASDFGVVAGAFGWNDPAGVAIASHGFGIHDRQTTLFGRLGRPGSEYLPGRTLFREIDGRPGYYVGANWRYLDRFMVRVLHYDNRADPSIFEPAINDFAWLTQFDGASARFDTGHGWTFLAQWLSGLTSVEPPGQDYDWKFRARFAMVSRAIGLHQLSARLEDFDVRAHEQLVDHGHAWTLAWTFQPNEHWRFATEWLDIRSDVARERQLQVSARYTFAQRFRDSR